MNHQNIQMPFPQKSHDQSNGMAKTKICIKKSSSHVIDDRNAHTWVQTEILILNKNTAEVDNTTKSRILHVAIMTGYCMQSVVPITRFVSI